MAKRDIPVSAKPASSVVPTEKKVTRKVEPEPETPTKLVVANCTRLNMREKPLSNSKVLSVLSMGTVVLVDGMVDDWFHIHVADDMKKEGYILAHYTAEV